MAANPMQRKARISFFLGMGITFVIAAIIIALLFMKNKQLNDKINSETSQKLLVSVLNQDVQYGQKLDASMFTQQEVSSNSVPSDATNIATVEGTPIAKVSMKANTVLTSSLVSVEELSASDREQTYSIITLPIDLEDGEYVDIRVSFPNGQDYIVLSKQKVSIPIVNGVYLSDAIKLTLSEAELLTMSSAIVDAAKVEGASVYAIKYAEADAQEAARETYVPSSEVINLIQSNPNAVDNASKELKSRWNSPAVENRNNYINDQVSQGDSERAKEKLQEEVEAKAKAREEYLTSLYGGVTN